MPLKFHDETTGRLHSAVVVHTEGQPGALVLSTEADAVGHILTPHMERPEWANGLAVALLGEHQHFYLSRLGTYAQPELYEAADLGWLAVNEETGDAIEIEADSEHRMTKLASLIGGIDREEGTIDGALAEVEMSLDHLRTGDEIGAMEDAGADLEQRRA